MGWFSLYLKICSNKVASIYVLLLPNPSGMCLPGALLFFYSFVCMCFSILHQGINFLYPHFLYLNTTNLFEVLATMRLLMVCVANCRITHASYIGWKTRHIIIQTSSYASLLSSRCSNKAVTLIQQSCNWYFNTVE